MQSIRKVLYIWPKIGLEKPKHPLNFKKTYAEKMGIVRHLRKLKTRLLIG